MRSRFYLILTCSLLFCLISSVLHARSLKQIHEDKELRICLADVHPSFVIATPKDCKDSCKFEGPNYEQALAFSQYLGKDIHPKFIRVNWQEQFFNSAGELVHDATYSPELMESGRCDVYPNNMTKTEWRTKKLDFVTLFPNRIMVIVPKSRKRQFRSSTDLMGKLTALVKDSSYHTWILNQNKTKFVDNPIKMQFMGNTEALKAVDSKAVDFTLSDANIAIWSIRHELKYSTVAFSLGEEDEIGWAFRKSDKALQSKAQLFFQEQLKPASTFNQIWKKYYGITLNQFISTIRATQ